MGIFSFTFHHTNGIVCVVPEPNLRDGGPRSVRAVRGADGDPTASLCDHAGMPEDRDRHLYGVQPSPLVNLRLY